MIIPGVLAQQGLIRSGGSLPATRPVFKSSSVASAESGVMSVPLPAGWSPGDLAILHIGSSSNAVITVTGWTEFASRGVPTTGTQRTFFRILQAGDGSASVPNAGKRCGLMLTFQAGTFNSATPVSAGTGSANSGTGTSVVSLVSDSVALAPYYRLQMAMTVRATFYTDTTTYPFPLIQLSRISGGSFPFPGIYVSGGEFDGGVDAASSFTRPASEPWATYKVLVNPAT